MLGSFERSDIVSPSAADFSDWRDLKRDWQRWSGTERLAAECVLGALALAAALSMLALPLP